MHSYISCDFTGAVGDVDLSFSSNTPIVLAFVICSGSEEHLIDCGHAGLGVENCHPIVGEATVLCTGNKCLYMCHNNIF